MTRVYLSSEYQLCVRDKDKKRQSDFLKDEMLRKAFPLLTKNFDRELGESELRRTIVSRVKHG